jgi:NADPH2:quinone reductase
VKAFVVRHRSGVRGGAWEEVADPRLTGGGAVIRVGAAALAWSDVLQMEGSYAGPVPDLPFISGHELAGEVVEVAPGATWSVGDRVFGFLPGPGAFAEYVAVSSGSLRLTPDELRDVDAAAFTTSYLTADVALRTIGGLTWDRSVLVHAAAGGVGHSAVQLACAYGVKTVVATAGTESRRAVARASGASATAGYDDFPEVVLAETGGRGVDVVLESVGGDVFDRSLDVVAPLGHVVTIGASSGAAPKRLKLPALWQRSLTVSGFHIGRMLEKTPELLAPSWDRLLALLAAGRIAPEIGLVVDLAGIGAGMEALRTRQVAGRVVIDFTAPAGRAGVPLPGSRSR